MKTNLRDYPLLVNTMSSFNGVGLMLLVDTIRLLPPTTVAQLHSKYQRKNFAFSLTPETVGSCRDSWRSPKTRLGYSLLGVFKGKVPPEALLASINNCLVDLCHVKEYQMRRPVDRPELYSVTARNVYKPSLGVGFVRNIDMEKAVLHLATYLRPDQLSDVNCLLAGQLQLPSSVLSGPGKSKHNPPYFGKETNNPLDATWQRYHKPR